MIGRRAEGVLRVPEAIALGPRGEVYVADQFSHVVQRFSRGGRFEGEWGSYGAGPGQFGGAIGGLAVDAHGDVYAVDIVHDRVERFDARGRFLGAWGRPGSAVGRFRFGTGRGPDAPPGGGIAVAGGHVYVVDTANDRIERFTLEGTEAVAWWRAGGDRARLASPRGIAVSASRVYVADTHNGRVVALGLDGHYLGQSARRAPAGHALNSPYGLAVHDGRVFVADDNGGRVVELTSRLRYVRAYTGRGRARLSKWLRAVAVGADGRLYVADSAHARVVVLDRHGTPLHTWGAAGTTHGEMTLPLDLAASRRGDLFVVGTYGILSPIYLFSRARRYRRSWYAGGRVAIGHHWFAPTALALAPDGSQWVTDSVNGLVRHLGAADGAFLGALPGDGGHTLRDPGGLAIGRAGEVYVADTGHGRVVRFAPDGRFLGSFGSTGPRRWRLRRPAALALDAHGDLYVADPGHDRIEKLGPSGAPIAVWGAVRGIGPLRGPDGIAVDARGHVFVSDRGEDRILELTSRGRLLTAWGRSGTGPGELGAPGGLSVDCRGEVLVADTQNNRVQVFTHAAARCAGSTHP